MKRCDDLKCDAGGFFCFKAQNLSLKKNTGKSVIARVSSPPPQKKIMPQDGTAIVVTMIQPLFATGIV